VTIFNNIVIVTERVSKNILFARKTMGGTMTRTVFSDHRVGRLLLVFPAAIPTLGLNLYTALQQYRPAADGIQEITLQAAGRKA
jgi:hypothetical protein